MPRKPACQTKLTSSSGFCRVGTSDWLFHRPALSIGQKTKLSLLRVFVELLQVHFHKCCFLLQSRHFSCEIASLDRTGFELLGQAAAEDVCGRERLEL